jgi:hypothetical protein
MESCMLRLVIIPVLYLSATGLAAQRQSDAELPLGVVERLFDAMRRRDTAAMRSFMDPSVRLVSVYRRDGVPHLGHTTLDAWLGAVGRATLEPDERIWDPSVEVDGELATVWVKYELRVGGAFSHCGVDAFQLFRGSEGWKIFQVADTRRREGCWHRPD